MTKVFIFISVIIVLVVVFIWWKNKEFLSNTPKQISPLHTDYTKVEQAEWHKGRTNQKANEGRG